MSNTLQKVRQNQTMDLCKMLAAVLVLMIHEPFPGRVGELFTLIGRFAVPMFLAVTGCFNLGANAKTIARRMLHILKLTAFACIFYSCSNALNAFLQGYPPSEFLAWDLVLPRLPALMRWLILHPNPFSEHLWYLTAVTLCYGLLWVYVSFFGDRKVDYRPFYMIGLFFGALLLYTAVIMPWSGADVSAHAYRNGWLTGIPMFTLGMFLNEYQDTLRKNLHLTDSVLVLLVLGGMGISICEWLCGQAGEITLGTLIMVPALVLLMICHPTLPVKSPAVNALIARFRSLSTGLYILHNGFIWVYARYVLPLTQSVLGDGEPWFRPLGLLLLSMPAVILWDRVDAFRHKKRK